MMSYLTPAQEQYLSRNGFVVVPSAEFEGMAEAYESLKERHRPIFVTTDALLHTAHLFFDYLLRAVEITTLRPQLVALTDTLLQASASDFAQATDPQVKEAARRNLAFFSVGAKLLEPAHPTSQDVEDLVQAEFELIEKRAVGAPLPNSFVLGIGEDYTQYIPRGHYTRNDAFRTYFQAAMWYGRLGFFVYPSESHSLSQADTERLGRQALLITRNLHQQRIGQRTALSVWRGIYETTALFAGRAEDPGPDEYLAIAQEIYGGLPDLAQLADETQLNAFLAQVRELPRPRVLSTFYWSSPQTDSITPRWQDGTLGFHFLPQRFVPDTHVFSELVWDRVGRYLGEGNPFTLYVSRYAGPYRGVPRGLDVLAAFGSELAERILQDEGDTAYAGYAEKLSELRALYARDELGQDFYHRWLGVLRALLEKSSETAPPFMQNEAWGHKQLNAALGSWAELRHDTILYIKQSYTSVARGAMLRPPPPSAYLEPCPQVYERLRGMITQMREQLDKWEMLEPDVRDKLVEFERLLDELTRIAERELAGQWPTELEMRDLAAIGQRLKALLDFPPALLTQITSGTDDRMALVADVHTHLEGGVVLEEAVGDPFLICVELEREGEPVRYWGTVFSYYEFKHPLKERLTDEAWQAMSPKPPLPLWTSAYLAVK
jgi:hypothetical protein